MKVDEFFYQLPEEAIAQSAAEPRDSARLLDTRDMSDHLMSDLPGLLQSGDLVVVNNTRVRKARLTGVKADTGGRVELLILTALPDGRWEGLIRPARRIHQGTRIRFGELVATVVDGPNSGIVTVDFDSEDVERAFEKAGDIPLPPYFSGQLPDPDRYQTMFARHTGSAAAPTAGLHFTPAIVGGLTARSICLAEVDLHVGIDTFRPMTVERVEDHHMHREWCSLPAETAGQINEARRAGGRIVAVGTTTVRTLETFALPDGTVSAGEKETDLFLIPGSPFHVVDIMLTNFHVPGSTLVAMVAGFMGDGWRDAYRHAVGHGYRFLSFGDAMICRRERG